MSKYCLSDCAKAKLSALQNFIVISSAVVGTILAALGIVGLVTLLFGYLVQFIWLWTGGISSILLPASPFEAGFVMLILALWTGLIGFLVYGILVLPFYKGIKALITNKFYVKQMSECKIFVKCED